MTEKKDVREQKPFMYIVQPKLAPPKTSVQSEIRIKKTHHDEIIEVEDIQGPVQTLPNPPLEPAEFKESQQQLPAAIEIDYEDESVIEVVLTEGVQEKEAKDIEEINVISIKKEVETQELLETEDLTEGNKEPQNGLTEDQDEVTFRIVHSSDPPENNSDTEQKKGPRKKIAKKFTDMSTDELLEYLIRIPRIVPKPFCEIKIDGRIIRGQIEKKKGDTIYIRPSYGINLIAATKEDIEYITFLNF
ncbi:CotO family spore coat protein [Peribacillus deserti]|uniref:Spore coat protein CotO n=1 Tax=Peribacillus deserti TaxID=673318 RepID=A0A2N5M7M8_9BACI|nr:CotO family spore coat protein [Peribacillus deserti]PLT30359.1 hypothetical protein CUU66_07765 [Peribacillus deserti]